MLPKQVQKMKTTTKKSNKQTNTPETKYISWNIFFSGGIYLLQNETYIFMLFYKSVLVKDGRDVDRI